MKTRALVLLIFVLLAGCSKKESNSFAKPRPLEAVVLQERALAKSNRYMAYEHFIQIDSDEGDVVNIYEAGQSACREAVRESCVILESKISSGRNASASLKFRTKPEGIKSILAALSKQGEITDQSTVAEDLAGPIEDAAKKLAMLRDYRTKLEALRIRAASDVDALIKVNRELSQVQSDLEEMTGNHVRLVERVETEVLNVSISAYRNQSFWRPIRNACSDFVSNLSQGASTAITGLAFFVPWALLISVFAWLGRKLWTRWKRPPAKT